MQIRPHQWVEATCVNVMKSSQVYVEGAPVAGNVLGTALSTLAMLLGDGELSWRHPHTLTPTVFAFSGIVQLFLLPKFSQSLYYVYFMDLVHVV